MPLLRDIFSKDFKATYAIEYKNNYKFKKYFKYAKEICEKIGIDEGPVTLDFIQDNGKDLSIGN